MTTLQKSLWIILALVVIGGLVWWGQPQKPAPISDEPIKIGAILPLTGGAAVYGEQLRNTMEMAKADYAAQGIPLEIYYEDSQALPAQGLSAYRKLVDTEHVDVVLTAFSRVSIPLVSVANTDKVPLIMTLVSATGAPSKSLYAFRLFSTSEQYVAPLFDTVLSTDTYKTIGVLYTNDEFGVSGRDSIRALAARAGLQVSVEESFVVGASDVRTQLTAIKSKNPDALIYVASTPAEITTIIRQARELQIAADLFDGANGLTNEAIIKDLGQDAEGVYVAAMPFVIGTEGQDFKQRYIEEFNQEPNFAAPFGYDFVRFVVEVTDGQKLSADDFLAEAANLKKLESFNGTLMVGSDREINPTLTAVQIRNGKLVPVE